MNNRNIKHTCTFTGHRPERLEIPEEHVIEWLAKQIRQASDEGYTDFITGMQRGVDLWAAEAVLKLRNEDREIRLIAACAFRGMENRWDTDWQQRYHHVLYHSDEVHYISDRPGRKAFFARNHWMVDHASRLIAVYSGAPGGTKETIDYARKKGHSMKEIADLSREMGYPTQLLGSDSGLVIFQLLGITIVDPCQFSDLAISSKMFCEEAFDGFYKGSQRDGLTFTMAIAEPVREKIQQRLDQRFCHVSMLDHTYVVTPNCKTVDLPAHLNETNSFLVMRRQTLTIIY